MVNVLDEGVGEEGAPVEFGGVRRVGKGLNGAVEEGGEPNVVSPVSPVEHTCSSGFPLLQTSQSIRTVHQFSTHISASRQRSSNRSIANSFGTTNCTSYVECSDTFHIPNSSNTGYSSPPLTRVPSGAPSLMRMSPYLRSDETSGTLITRIRAGSSRSPQTTSAAPLGSRRIQALPHGATTSPGPSLITVSPTERQALRASSQLLNAVAAIPRFQSVASSPGRSLSARWFCSKLFFHFPSYFASRPRS